MNRTSMTTALLLVALVLGCASHEHDAHDKTKSESAQTMSDSTKLGRLSGSWSGKSSLYLFPGDPVRESQSQATFEMSECVKVATIRYDWSYEGKPQDGVMVIREESQGEDVQISWIDSFHTAGKFMNFQHDDQHKGVVAVRGSYAAPPGPDWGWRIVIDSDDDDQFKLTMFNITPDGQEALAVDAEYHRR